MTFYRFKVQQGHHGRARYEVLKLYITAPNFASARAEVRRFPSVKHTASRCILEGVIIDEREYVCGIIQNAYARNNCSDNILTTLAQVSRQVAKNKGYEWETEEGKMLCSYYHRYIKAKDDTSKQLIEQEYYNWAQSLVDNEVYGL